MHTVKSDITVVGGGIIGLAGAYYLSKNGFKVSVVERDPNPKNASWAGAGILNPLHMEKYSDVFLNACFESLSLFESLSEDIYCHSSINVNLIKTGMHIISIDKSDHSEVIKLKKLLSERALEFSILDARELMKSVKGIAHDVKYSLFLPWCSQIRNDLMLKGLRAALVNLGAHIIYENVSKVNKKNSRINYCASNSCKFVSDYYIIAGGPWSSELLNGDHAELESQPIKGYIILARSDKDIIKEIIKHKDSYIVPRSSGDYLLGSTLLDEGFDKSIKLGPISHIIEKISEFLPGISEWQFIKVWMGLRPKLLKRTNPIIDFHPDFKNLIIASGHYRNGIMLAPLTGKMINSYITHSNEYNKFMKEFSY